MIFFITESSLLGLIFAALALGFAFVSEGNIGFFEKAVRNRYAGFLLALPALIHCIPYAEVVSPGFLLPLLWPLAVGIPVLCFFFIDFYTARAIAGAAILYAYDLVHTAYEWKLPGAVIWTVLAWLIGIGGIWISAKPWLLRDAFRKAAKSRSAAFLAAALCALSALTAAGSLASALF